MFHCRLKNEPQPFIQDGNVDGFVAELDHIHRPYGGNIYIIGIFDKDAVLRVELAFNRAISTLKVDSNNRLLVALSLVRGCYGIKVFNRMGLLTHTLQLEKKIDAFDAFDQKSCVVSFYSEGCREEQKLAETPIDRLKEHWNESCSIGGDVNGISPGYRGIQ